MIARLTVVLCLAVAMAACEKKASTTATETAAPATKAAPAEPTATPTAGADAHVHNVACGCSMGQKCSNMIEVDGEFVPLRGDLKLGPMEFCGKKGVRAKAAGRVIDGGFLATSFEVIEPAKAE